MSPPTATTPAVVQSFVFGDPGDAPVVGDWDGNGADTPMVVRNGAWYLRNSNTEGIGEHAFRYGDPSDVPMAGDWNYDGMDTPGVVRGAIWHLRDSTTTGPGEVSFAYGDPGDEPLTWR